MFDSFSQRRSGEAHESDRWIIEFWSPSGAIKRHPRSNQPAINLPDKGISISLQSAETGE